MRKTGRWPLGLESCDLGKSKSSEWNGEKPNCSRREAVSGIEEVGLMEAPGKETWAGEGQGAGEGRRECMGSQEGFIFIVNLSVMGGLGSIEKL